MKNFGILGDVEVRLGRLNVLVGPNGSGKSTLLGVIDFLGDAARTSLANAIEKRFGWNRVHTRGGRGPIQFGITADVTANARQNAPDEYDLTVWHFPEREAFVLEETFRFKRTAGQGRRITLKNGRLSVSSGKGKQLNLTLDKDAFGLAVLPSLGPDRGAGEVRKVQELFTTFRVLDVDAVKARAASDLRGGAQLKNDGSNLAAFLAHLHAQDPGTFSRLVRDAKAIVPGLKDLKLRPVGGATEAAAIDLVDEHLPGVTPLADASFGTVRALALLAMLHDPKPPTLTCVEEIDHGLHPHVFDRLVDLLREASKRTQFLIATHSPALVNRLDAGELIVCERGEDGLARIPAVDAETVREVLDGSPYGLGELWFSGTLGGVPQ